MPPVSGASTASLAASDRANGSEKVVSRTRACGFLRASATTDAVRRQVLPVPAEPATREAPRSVGRNRTLRGMQENAPPLPRIVERLAQFLLVDDQSDAALRVGMDIGIGARLGRRYGQRAVASVLQQASAASAGQVRRYVEERVLARRAHITDPVGRHPDRQQRRIAKTFEQQPFLGARRGN